MLLIFFESCKISHKLLCACLVKSNLKQGIVAHWFGRKNNACAKCFVGNSVAHRITVGRFDCGVARLTKLMSGRTVFDSRADFCA